MKTRKFTAAGEAVTPVPTAFLAKDMLDAPSDYVKVYLYGLYLAGQNIELDEGELESRLHMKGSEIEEALAYWARLGLLQSDGSGAVQYGKAALPQREPYPYVSFNLRIAALIGHEISAEDLRRIYDWMDTYGFPQDVVLMLIDHCVQLKGQRVSIDYMDKVAESWANSGVDTVEKAQNEISGFRAATGGARQVLRRMGVSRVPGKTEMDLYEKWTGEWGFTHEGVLQAMHGREFASISAPFGYLDSILKDLHGRGLHRAQEIAGGQSERSTEREDLRKILDAVGRSGARIEPKHEDAYRRWTGEWGFSMDVILLACRKSAAYKGARFDKTEAILDAWRKQGLCEEQICELMEKDETIGQRVEEVLEAARIERAPTEDDKNWYRQYTEQHKMDHDVLMYAATLSWDSKSPLGYIKKTLKRWSDNNVSTLAQARAANDEFNTPVKRPSNARALSYAQRPQVVNAEQQRGAMALQKLKERYGSE